MRRLVFISMIWLCILQTAAAQPSFNCRGAMPSRLVVGELARILPVAGSNLRELPNPNTRRLEVVPPGTELRVLDGPVCDGVYAWWQVQYLDYRGWMAEGYADVYWMEPFITHVAQAATIRFEYEQTLARDVEIERVPLPVGDELVEGLRFDLSGYVLQRSGLNPSLSVTPMSYYEESASRSTLNAIRQLPAMLRQADNPQQVAQLLDDNGIASGAMAIRQIDYADGSGLRFLLPADLGMPSGDLSYAYRSLSNDGDYYISLNVPLRVANLPEAPNLTEFEDEDEFIAAYEAYRSVLALQLDSLPNEAFVPDLGLLDRMIASLTTQADAVRADGEPIDFAYLDRVSFRYSPLLTSLPEARIMPEDRAQRQPTYLQIDFPDYVVRTWDNAPALRVYVNAYFAEIGNSNKVAQLAQLEDILSNQPAKPVSIPMLAFQNSPQFFRAQIRYLRFENGAGIRFLTAYPGDTVAIGNAQLFYAYAGISDDGNFTVQAIMPLTIDALDQLPGPETMPSYDAYIRQLVNLLDNTDSQAFNPPLTTLDSLMSSIRVGGID